MSEYGFGVDFERSLVASLCQHQRLFKRIGMQVDPAALTDVTGKLLLEAAQAFARDSGGGPDDALLVVQRLRRMMHDGRVTQEQINAAVDYLDDAEDAGLLPADQIASEVIPVLRRQAEKAAVRDIVSTHGKRGDITPAVEALHKAQRIGDTSDVRGVRLGSGSFASIEQMRNLVKLPLDVPEIDAVLDGGLWRRALGVVIANTGGGKSMYLSHMAATSALNGLRVAYATLELPEALVLARLKANLIGMPINDILGAKMEEAKTRIEAMEASLGACVVREFTPMATQVSDIKDWVRDLEQDEGAPLDLLIVDYADKVGTAKRAHGDTSSYDAGRIVYDGLREFAMEKNLWCWTASQAQGRGKEGNKKIGMEHVADSMHKVRIADIVLTITAEEEGEQLLYYVAKNRLGRAHLMAGPFPHEFAIGRMAPVERYGDAWEGDGGGASDDYDYGDPF